MTRTSVLAVVSVLIAVSAAPAQEQAQPKRLYLGAVRDGLPDGLAQGPYSFYVLVQNPSVIKELGLSAEQKSKLEDFAKKFKQTQDRALKGIEENRQQAIKALRENRDGPDSEGFKEELSRIGKQKADISLALVEEADAEILRKILDRRQGSRLKEIRLQAEGPAAFKRPEVQESLGMDDDQIAEIRQIRVQGLRNLREAATLQPGIIHPRPGGDETPESKLYEKAAKDARGNVAGVRVATMRAISKTLTKAQRVKYQKMIGEPFDFLQTRTPDPSNGVEKTATGADKVGR